MLHKYWGVAQTLMVCAIFFGGPAYGDNISVLRPVWDSLSTFEKARIQATHMVSVGDPASYASIIENPGIDESTPESNVGAVTGGAVAGLAYVNRSFRGSNNYNPAAHLAIGVVGALLGSTLDSRGHAAYRFRYALKGVGGEISYHEIVQSNPFPMAKGTCLDLKSMLPVSQSMCNPDADAFRLAYLKPLDNASQAVEPATGPDTIQVRCQIGVQAPVNTDSATCRSLNGVEK